MNLLADMGAQPATLISGLTPATASTDTTPPTSTITSPAPGASLSDGSAVTITGTATDAGGGVVAGVEVSTDGGTTWHPVTTMSAANTSVNWSYNWVAHGNPSTKIESRAVDDSGNLETPTDSTTVNVNCPCSIWGNGVTPGGIDSSRFQLDRGGGQVHHGHVRGGYWRALLQSQREHRHPHRESVDSERSTSRPSATFTASRRPDGSR